MNPIRSKLIETSGEAQRRRLLVLRNNSPCKKKCYHCCSRMVQITIAEAIIIYDYLLKNHKWDEVSSRCKELLSISKNSNPISWSKMNILCPVLDPEKKLCLAYKFRPPSCSTHFVTSNPKACDPWNYEKLEYNNEQMNDLVTDFYESLSKLVANYGVLSLLLPLPVALVFAERINKIKEIDYHQLNSLITNEITSHE